jgi:hypothetical protein
MSLNPIRPGLRAIRHDAASPSKVSLSIPPGDELFVSDVVAAQLVATSRQFKEDVDEVVEPDVVEQATAAPGELRQVTKKAPPRKTSKMPWRWLACGVESKYAQLIVGLIV